MGKYFVMSKRFNKVNAADFGLIQVGNDTAVSPVDGSTWQKEQLFDLGWGYENGYYRVPLPDFSHLLSIVLAEDNEEDVWGAAAIIERLYPEDLLIECENMLSAHDRTKDFDTVFNIFKLYIPVNRSPSKGKTYQEIQMDYKRWKRLSDRGSSLADRELFEQTGPR